MIKEFVTGFSDDDTLTVDDKNCSSIEDPYENKRFYFTIKSKTLTGVPYESTIVFEINKHQLQSLAQHLLSLSTQI